MDISSLIGMPAQSSHVISMLQRMDVGEWSGEVSKSIFATKKIRLDLLGWSPSNSRSKEVLGKSIDQIVDMFVDEAVAKFLGVQVDEGVVGEAKNHFIEQYCLADSNEGIYKDLLPSFAEVAKKQDYDKVISFCLFLIYGLPNPTLPPRLTLGVTADAFDLTKGADGEDLFVHNRSLFIFPTPKKK